MIRKCSLTCLWGIICLVNAFTAMGQRAGFQAQQSFIALPWIRREGVVLDENRRFRFPFGLSLMYETARKDIFECHFSGSQKTVSTASIGLGNSDKNGEDLIGIASVTYGALLGTSTGGGASHHLNFTLMTVYNQFEIINLSQLGAPPQIGPKQRNFHLIPALGYRSNFHVGKAAMIHLGASVPLQRMSWSLRESAIDRVPSRSFEVKQFPGFIFNIGLSFWLSKAENR